MLTSSTMLALSLTPTSVSELMPVVIAYVGPDQILPFTSFIGAALGLLLIFWNRAVGAARRFWTLLWRK